MKNLDQLYAKIFRSRFIIPVCFVFTLFLSAFSIALIMRRTFFAMDQSWAFSVGADIVSIAVCAALCFSCLLSRNNESNQKRAFVILLTVNAFALFLDEASWVLQGKGYYRAISLNVNVLFYMNGAVLVYLFWRYITKALNMKTLIMRIADHFLRILLIPALLMCMANYVYPVYFKITATGNYQRAEYWYLSQLYLGIALLVSLAGMIFSKAPVKNKLIAASFIAIPLLNQFITRYTFGITTQFAATLVSIVLIYGVLFAENEKTIASTETELRLATRIQSDMLPKTFPFLPERSEFDLYASMTPAKEVGGDFYDFFMIDNDHLALVIADVSDKGVPAALFMMASKILIKNCVMTNTSPAKALETVNRRICENNSLEMFITVWLGVLDLRSGVLTSSNAGHEYPIIINPDSSLNLFKKRNGFVVGGFSDTNYTESKILLRPGSKLFLFTDGVTDSENGKEKQYGSDRLLKILYENKDNDPSEIVDAVKEDVEIFTQNSSQSDDLTMLCIHYTGRGGKEVP